jgi:hypothetical protein
VAAVDAPVTLSDIRAIAREVWKFANGYLARMALALLRLCRGAGIHVDGGRAVGLARVNPNLIEAAIGIRSEDDVRLVGSAVAARPYIDRFLSYVKAVAQVPRTRLLDLSSRGLRASGRGAPNCRVALHKLQAVTRHTRNVRRVGFGCVACFPCASLRLFVNRVLDNCEVAT